MKSVALVLGFVLGAPALAAEFSVKCTQGVESEEDYKSVVVSAAIPLQKLEIGTTVTVVIRKNVRLGDRNVFMVTTPLTGKVIEDSRTATVVDPATLIELYGRDEVGGTTSYGVLFARPDLANANNIQVSVYAGGGMTVICE